MIYRILLIVITCLALPKNHLFALTLEQNTADVVRLDQNVSEIFVANPDIADVQLNSPSVAYVYGKKPGQTTIAATDASGRTILNLNVTITHNLKRLKEIVANSFADEKVSFESTPGGLVLSGSVTSPQKLKSIEKLAEGFLGRDEKIVNMLSVKSPTQVYLKVKVAEVSRTVLNQMDINWASAINSSANWTFGVLTGRAPLNTAAGTDTIFNRNTGSPPLNSIGGRYNRGRMDLTTLIDALDHEGLGTVLAEPNLIATSGETASFLVGGEFPYPVPQDNSVTIDFKQFGISLSFTPTVLDGDLINLRVRPEVSELDSTNQVSINVGANSVLSVPGIKTRRAETQVELGDGQSLAIAGLFSNFQESSIKELPGLADIPVLGALFRSTSFQRKETELVIIVTPYIVQPTHEKNLTLPTTSVHYASHLEMMFLGRLNKKDANAQVQSHHALKDVRLVGNAGFFIE